MSESGGNGPAKTGANADYLFRDQAATLQVGGSVTTPGAGAAIATLNGLTVGGIYEITVFPSYGVIGDVANNMKLELNSGGQQVVVPVQGGNNTVPVASVYVEVATTAAVTVNAVAAGAAGSVYNAIIIARRVG